MTLAQCAYYAISSFFEIHTIRYKSFQTQLCPTNEVRRAPTCTTIKTFFSSKGKVSLEVMLDKEIYMAKETIPIQIIVNNTSGKTVTSIRVRIIYYTLKVIATKEECDCGGLTTTGSRRGTVHLNLLVCS